MFTVYIYFASIYFKHVNKTARTKVVNILHYLIQVMMQLHNRQMSFSLYISALAVSDTMVVLTGKLKLLVSYDTI